MRLLRARIENFGKISDATFDFSEHCQIFCEDNGWGKSTLAAFLCVMFYGFDGEKKRDGLANERKRYEPWQKGIYGGSITFIADGKTYVLSRIFGKKEAQDEFNLRAADTNLESKDYSVNIGEELFQIDRASFCRTIFLSQHDCETYATDAVNAKIGNLINHTDDVNNFASAYTRLKDVTNSMRPNHKKGSLKQLKEDIASLENQVRNEEILAKRMEETTLLRKEQVEKWKRCQEEIILMEKKQQSLSGDLDLQSKRTEYKALCEAWNEQKEELDEILECFLKPDCIPEAEEIEEYQEQEKRCRELAGFVKQNTLSEHDLRQYKELLERWGGVYPTEEQMTKLEQSNRQLIKLRMDLASYGISTEERKRLQELEERYKGHVPKADNVVSLQKELEEAKHKEETLLTKKATVATLEQMVKPKKTLLPFLIIGIFLMISGVPGILIHRAAGGVAIVMGILCVGIGYVLKRTSSVQAETGELQNLREQIEEDKRFIQETYTKTAKYLSDVRQVSQQSEPGQSELVQMLEETVRETMQYAVLLEKKGSTGQQEQRQYAEQLAGSIHQFLQQYAKEIQSEENWATQLADIRLECIRMKQWKKKREDYEKAKRAYQEQYADLREYLDFLGYAEEDDAELVLRELLKNVRDYESGKERYYRALERKNEFEKAHDMEKLLKHSSQEEEASLTEMTEKIHQAREEQKCVEQLIRDYEERLTEDQEQWDLLQEIKVELEDKQERYAEGLHKYQLLCKTMDLLQEAKDNLTARYLEPVKKGFDKYYEMMSGASAEDYHFDAGVNLTVMEQGLQRDTKFLSEGYQDMLGICTRLAFVDAMYQGEKPFLIFDDPFVNLDEEKTKGALKFLKSVSEEYQIVYFTCHESRVM